MYTGEHFWVGWVGQSAVVCALASALFCAIGFVLSFHQNADASSWRVRAHVLFRVHALCCVLVFAALLHILYHHLFEYVYAYQHSSRSLPVQYVLSALWEGQEGSFILWALWNAILGLVFLSRKNMFAPRAMVIVAVVQSFIFVFLLGAYVGDVKIGSNPFALLRNEVEAPIFARADYLSFISDGKGLNALLQNYWMVIHPPVLFLGFSAVLFPFALSVGALWARNETGLWTKTALRWALFAAGVLGLGIMMGAAWAYESLTFGGYWAWDPVENASLVPWLLLVAALHANIIVLRKKQHLRTCVLLYILAYLFVLYSTYLTRSGVLGQTSVHSFTNLGMNGLLLLLLGTFCVGSLSLFVWRYKRVEFAARRVADTILSRDAGMFLGVTTLFFSALIITLKTSLPVVNLIFGTKYAPPQDVVQSFNRSQIYVGLLLMLGMGVSVLLSYRRMSTREVLRACLPFMVAAVVLGTLGYFFLPLRYATYGRLFQIALLCTWYAAVFAVLVNGFLFWRRASWRAVNKRAAFVTHFGFALMLVAILVSAAGKRVVSKNPSHFSPLREGTAESPAENITLIQHKPLEMGDYTVTYLSDSAVGSTVFYRILFTPKHGKHNAFILCPDVISNTKGMEGVSPNPDAKHFWNKDLFVYLTYLPAAAEQTDYGYRSVYTVRVGDTVFMASGKAVVDSVTQSASARDGLRVHVGQLFSMHSGGR